MRILNRFPQIITNMSCYVVAVYNGIFSFLSQGWEFEIHLKGWVSIFITDYNPTYSCNYFRVSGRL